MTTFIGAPQPRIDAFEKVTGQADFIADLNLGRMLHARVVRSTHGHALLRRVDASRALAVPGVRAVITGEHCPKRIGFAINDHTVIACRKVRYVGEPVAVVVAVSEEVADQAARLVDVEYEPLPVLVHPREAVAPGAPLIHEDLEEYAHDPVVHPQPGTNIAHRYRLLRGNVEQAFREAHLVVENEYWVPWIAHVQMEPHGAIAQYDGKQMTIYTSSQSPFYVRETVAYLLEMPSSNVRVQVPYVGGGFGGKSDVTIEPLLALVAYHVPGLPIRLLLTREEMFFGTVNGRGCWGRMKTAVDREGKLLAHQSELYFGSGGYADYSIWISQGGGHNATGPYYIPNLDLRSHAVYTNTPPTGAYRGYGHPEVHWMMERQMDQIARRLGMDAVELRLRNLLRPGLQNAIGQTMKEYNGRADACLLSVRDALGSEKVPTVPGRIRAQGIACFMKSPVMKTNAQSGAVIKFNEDGTATLFTGSIEMGQGVNTILTQIAAETLHMPIEQVQYAPVVDTEYSPQEWQTVASHSTWAVGNAVRMAAEDALEQLRQAAALVFDVPPDEILADDGCLYPQGKPEKALPYSRFAVGYTRPDGSALNPPVIGRGMFVPRGLTFPDPATGQGNMAASWTFGCQGVDLEIDPDTGQIHVLKMVSAQDAGRIINPVTARGQVEGAMTMALGAALMEKLKFAPDGRILNAGFVDYRILCAADVPEMEVIFIETPDATGPYGARGLGEHGIVAIPPAVANAVAQALGVDFYELPVTPDQILSALELRRKGGASV